MENIDFDFFSVWSILHPFSCIEQIAVIFLEFEPAQRSYHVEVISSEHFLDFTDVQGCRFSILDSENWL